MMKRLFSRLGYEAKQALNLAGLNGIYWFATSFSCFQAVYLQGIGFSASNLGLLNAIGSAVAIASVSFWGMVSDKTGSVKKILVLLLTLGVGLYALVPLIPANLPYSPLLFLIYLPAINVFRGAMGNMTDNILVRNCNELRLNFGMIRSAGSFLYMVGGVLIAALLPFVGLSWTFWLSALCMIPAILFACFAREPRAKPVKQASDGKGGKLNLGALFKSYPYVTFLIFAFLFYTATSCEGTFVPYLMKSIGVDTGKYSLLLAYRALFEIPFLLLMVRLRRKFPLRYLVMAAAVLMGLECVCFGLFANSLGTMILFCTFFGLGNGLFLGSALNYVYELAPDNLKASAQAFFVAVQSTAGILGNLIGGVVFDAIGAKPFYLAVSSLFLLSILVFGASILREKKREAVKNPA